MKIFDITVTLRNDMPSYPGEAAPRMSALQRIATGGVANVSHIEMVLHSGTHLDAPWHFNDAGRGMEAFPLEQLCGPARVVQIEDPSAVTAAELARKDLAGATRILFRTRNCELWQHAAFQEDYVYLDPGAAEWLVERGVRLVGIDYLSVESFPFTEPRTHRTLLDAGIAILEGLDLRDTPPGDYELWCLPLKVHGTDGAPARAVLVQR